MSEAGEMVSRLWDLDGLLLAAVRDGPPDRGVERYRIPLLFHRHEPPCLRFVDTFTITVESDRLTPAGLRVVRPRYLYPVDPEIEPRLVAAVGADAARIRRARRARSSSSSLSIARVVFSFRFRRPTR